MSDRDDFILGQIRRLADIYRIEAKAIPTIAKEWSRIFTKVPFDALSAAVSRYIEVGQYFPRPNAIRGLLREMAPEYEKPELSAYEQWGHNPTDQGTGEMIPCPICGAKWVWSPRLTIKHDNDLHDSAGLVAYWGVAD